MRSARTSEGHLSEKSVYEEGRRKERRDVLLPLRERNKNGPSQQEGKDIPSPSILRKSLCTPGTQGSLRRIGKGKRGKIVSHPKQKTRGKKRLVYKVPA